MIEFGDSAEAVDQIPFGHAALYAGDCDWPCPPGQDDRWAPVNRRWITFTGLRNCSIADYEPHTEVYQDPARLTTWAKVRREIGRDRIVYSDLSDVPSALEHLRGISVQWWLATLDNVQHTADALSLKLATQYGVIIHPATIFGCQWRKGEEYDTSDCYGAWR